MVGGEVGEVVREIERRDSRRSEVGETRVSEVTEVSASR